MAIDTLTAAFQIKVDGAQMSQAYYQALHSVTVDTSLHMPDLATLEFRAEKLDNLDSDYLAQMGRDLEILAATHRPGSASDEGVIFKGTVTAIQGSFAANHEPRLVVRAYSAAYALQLGTRFRAFVNVTDGDIARKVISDAGLEAQVDSTSVLHKHVFQPNISDWEFLQQRARAIGYVVVGKGKKVKFVKPVTLEGAAEELEYNTTLIDLDITLTAAGQATEVEANGWNPQEKKAVSARSNNSTWKTTTLESGAPTKALNGIRAGNAKRLTTLGHALQNEAEGVAKAEYDRGATQFAHARGTCSGNPGINAGTRVKLVGIGTRFSGEYTVTRARHVLNNKDGYTTEFWIDGTHRGTLASALLPEGQAAPRQHWSGLVSAIVTNNQDDEGQARIKVKYPWLDDGQESSWARLVAPGAGKDRGLIVVPEVNDEVVVGFFQGDFNQPFVLGGVWNGKDGPPAKAVSSGEVQVRQFKTRIGQELTFDDTKGSEKIQILDTKGNKVVIDGGGKQILFQTDGDFIVKAQGQVKITGKSVDVTGSSGDVKLKGINVAAEGSAKAALKAPLIDIAGSGPVTIKGAVVKIN